MRTTPALPRWIIMYAVLSTTAILFLAWRSFVPDREVDLDLLRTRGIVVVDSAGRDRILIGAPVPWSPHRIRTDTALARRAWAQELGGEAYMGYYDGYRHQANGMLVLNAAGYDKLVVGDDLPDPNTGQRITEPTGLLWNNDAGFEMGGIGANRLRDGSGWRNTMGFDDPNGEGLHVIIAEDGSKAIRFVTPTGQLLLGNLAAHGLFGDTTAFTGLRCTDASGNTLQQLRMDLPAE